MNQTLAQGGRPPDAAGKSHKHLEAERHPDCLTCQRMIESGKFYGPSHTPSLFCRSGKRPHCSCGSCY